MKFCYLISELHYNDVIEVIEQTFGQMDGVTNSVEDIWGKVKETLLDFLNNDIGKMAIAPI